MAASDARPVPIKNTAYRLSFDIRDQEGDLITGGITGLDSEVSLDGAAFADCSNESTEIGTSSCLFLDLTAAEMNADTVFVKVTCTNTGAKPFTWALYPAESADIVVTVATNNDKTGYALSGAGVTAVQSGLATGADLATVDGNVDTILTRTDVATSTRLASASYTAPDNAGIDAIEAVLAANLDVAVSTRLASAAYIAPDNASVATILTRTDVATSTRATPAQVNAEVVDALSVDTYAEPASVPVATASLKDKIGWLMALARNKRTTTATTDTLRNDADSGNIATAAISDDGTTFTRSEYT